jgi:hypothetical protein
MRGDAIPPHQARKIAGDGSISLANSMVTPAAHIDQVGIEKHRSHLQGRPGALVGEMSEERVAVDFVVVDDKTVRDEALEGGDVAGLDDVLNGKEGWRYVKGVFEDLMKLTVGLDEVEDILNVEAGGDIVEELVRESEKGRTLSVGHRDSDFGRYCKCGRVVVNRLFGVVGTSALEEGEKFLGGSFGSLHSGSLVFEMLWRCSRGMWRWRVACIWIHLVSLGVFFCILSNIRHSPKSVTFLLCCSHR